MSRATRTWSWGALGLFLVSLLIAPAPATAQLTCVDFGDWIIDEEGDGYVTQGPGLFLDGHTDITFLRVGETGVLCDQITFELVTGSSALVDLEGLLLDTVEIDVDLTPVGGDPQWTLRFKFIEDQALGSNGFGNSWVWLLKDGLRGHRRPAHHEMGDGYA